MIHPVRFCEGRYGYVIGPEQPILDRARALCRAISLSKEWDETSEWMRQECIRLVQIACQSQGVEAAARAFFDDAHPGRSWEAAKPASHDHCLRMAQAVMADDVIYNCTARFDDGVYEPTPTGWRYIRPLRPEERQLPASIFVGGD